MSRKIEGLDVYPRYGALLANPWSLKRKLIYKILPIHTLYPLKDELRLAWVRWKSRSVPHQYRNANNLLVNLGAGGKGKPGWINVDSYPFPGINCVYDCRKQLPFPDESVNGIFCEHFFEHIDYTEEVPYFLSECRRVLKPGGVMRIVVPDSEQYMRAYCMEGWDEISKVRPLDSEQRDHHYHCKIHVKMELINLVFRQGSEHKYAYDYANLEFVLSKFGFSKILKQSVGESLLPEICLDQSERASESLYVDAVR